MNIESVRAVVTGGGSGMGREFVLQLAKAGATVAFCDVSQGAIDETVEMAGAAGLSVHGFRADVSDEASVETLFADVVTSIGPANVLINNAGIFRDGMLVKLDRETRAVKRMSLAAWNQVISVDLTGPFLCTREFASAVLTHSVSQSVVVNISSIARHGNPGQSNYSAAKAGLIADTKLWSVELAKYGIRVGAVAPGFVETPILKGMRPEVLGEMLKAVPLGRPAQPIEIYQAVRFIIECDYFTGRCIDVDGGLTL